MSDTATTWNETEVRAAFPALAQSDQGMPRVYVDAPAGTQVAQRVLTRMHESLVEHCANDAGVFRTTRRATERMLEAHAIGAEFLGAGSDQEVVFGLNTTTLVFHFSHMLARDWKAGDNIVLSRMDHDANAGPWVIAAEERGVTVRWLEFDTSTFRYRYEMLRELIDGRTKLVACNHASNLLGTINDVRRIVTAGRAVGAVTVVDAVQSAPHFLIDARGIGCDLLWSSPYKYFGPHAGLAYVRRELADRLVPLKVRPCPDTMPFKHSPGTPSFEAQLGTVGAIEHIAWLGERFGGVPTDAPLRERLRAGYAAAAAHETVLAKRFMAAIRQLPGITLYGIGELAEVGERVPTFSIRVKGHSPEAVAEAFAARNIFVWNGSFYAYEIAGALGVRDTGGVVRIGFTHYNTVAEVDKIIALLRELATTG
jgi:cysteine desulfurase family protein (TIGR01976 family)